MQNFFLRFLEKRLKFFSLSKKSSSFVLMNESYLLEKFEEYEKSTGGWDELYHVGFYYYYFNNFQKINVDSENQEKELGLSCDVSNLIANIDKNRYRNVLPCKYKFKEILKIYNIFLIDLKSSILLVDFFFNLTIRCVSLSTPCFKF